MDIRRIDDLKRFNSTIDRLTAHLRGARVLARCNGRLHWPQRGIYFFMENGEVRSNSGVGPRIVRIGTHALKVSSTTKLWTRLSQHRGQASNGGGNHRGSIFRLIVGSALMARDGCKCETWGKGSSANFEIRSNEISLEREVSRYIGAMPFVWVDIDDEPGAGSLRGYIERNAIALLSNYNKEPIDAPSADWLGHYCDREKVRKSGLWNSNHVDEKYDSKFLDYFEELVITMEKSI